MCGVEDVLKDFPMKFELDGKCTFPASLDMFSEDTSKTLNKEKREPFHTFASIVCDKKITTRSATNRSSAMHKNKSTK